MILLVEKNEPDPIYPGADAIASGAALLQAFYDLLVDLFGLSVTERVLRCVWANHLPALEE